jgi:hypothetical protein
MYVYYGLLGETRNIVVGGIMNIGLFQHDGSFRKKDNKINKFS